MFNWSCDCKGKSRISFQKCTWLLWWFPPELKMLVLRYDKTGGGAECAIFLFPKIWAFEYEKTMWNFVYGCTVFLSIIWHFCTQFISFSVLTLHWRTLVGYMLSLWPLLIISLNVSWMHVTLIHEIHCFSKWTDKLFSVLQLTGFFVTAKRMPL